MISLRRNLEHAIPSKFSKFCDVRVEHVHAGISVTEFKNAALGLSLNDGVGEFRRRQACAGGIVVEEICMQVEGVDQVELEDVNKIDAYGFPDLDLDGVIMIMKRNPVDRVKIIRVVEVHIDAVHHHDQFAIDRRTSLLWIDDERAIQPLGDVACQRKDMAMIEMETKRLCIKLVGEALPRFDEPAGPCAGDTVHCAGMESVEVDRVRMVAPITKVNTNTVTFGGSDGGTRDSSVIGPGRKLDPRKNFNILIKGNDLIFPQGLPIWQRGDFAIIEICQDIGGIETIFFMIHFTNGAGQIAMITLLHGMRRMGLHGRVSGMVTLILSKGRCSCRAQKGKATHLEKISSG